MQESDNNYAFIDGNNLNLGIRALGWKVDYARFRTYLKDKYGARKAYLFLGFMPENQVMYTSLQEDGFVLVFKPIIRTAAGEVKGNCDADLVPQSMIDYSEYEQAVIVTSDGDFGCLVNYLYSANRLRVVLSPNVANCSILLKKAARERIIYMNNSAKKLAYHHNKPTNEKAPL